MKLLLLAGALSDDPHSAEAFLGAIGTEESYQRCCCKDHACENFYYALYEMVDRAAKGAPWMDVEIWQDCIGKTVRSICADAKKGPAFERLPGGQYAFYDRLYFDCGDSVIMVEGSPNLYGCALPNEQRRSPVCLDELFPHAIGQRVEAIRFRHNSFEAATASCRQPVITVDFENGVRFRFTTNFGEMPKGSEFNYFEVFE